MARSAENRVDYFSHECGADKALRILEKRFGNDGYACFYKSREMLGNTEGHYLSLPENSDDWDDFCDLCHITSDRCVEILCYMAGRGMIDAELWKVDRVIWSEDFSKSLALIYAKRKRPVPTKPAVSRPGLPGFGGAKPRAENAPDSIPGIKPAQPVPETPISEPETLISGTEKAISEPEMRQSIAKHSIANSPLPPTGVSDAANALPRTGPGPAPPVAPEGPGARPFEDTSEDALAMVRQRLRPGRRIQSTTEGSSP
jgi:hypothetical protein